MKIFFITLILLVSSNAFSAKMLKMEVGDWGSGGGNALVCFSSSDMAEAVVKNKYIVEDKHLTSITSIEVYDLYEAKKQRGLSSTKPEIVKIGEKEEFYDYFNRLAKRFEEHNHLMSYLVESAQVLIPDSQILFHDAAVKNQNDLGNVTLPRKNCLIITMAAQVNYFSYYQVHIDERLFFHPAHTKQSQATLILHELFYAVARKNFKHTDSGSTRNLLRYLITYHSSVNEGSVSNALVDLKFSDGRLESTGIVSRYSHSEIMVQRARAIKSAIQVLSSELIDSFLVQSSKGNKLFFSVLTFMNLEGWYEEYTETSVYGLESIFVLRDLVKVGIEKNKNEKSWSKFKVRLDEVNIEFRQFVKDKIAEAESTIRSSAINPGHLTTLQNDILSTAHFSIFSQIERVTELDDGLDGMQEMMNIQDGDFNEIFVKELFMTLERQTCRSNSQQEPTCLGPLKLNNIIPRI